MLQALSISIKKWVPVACAWELATREADIRRTVVRSQSGKIVLLDPIVKKIHHKKGLVEWLKV
jgi:hypothetical protein